MKAVVLMLLALVAAHPSALAQDAEALPAQAEKTAARETAPPSSAPIDARAYWARFDAEQSARRARLDSVDVRTPKIVTLSLAAPAATLLLSVAFNTLAAGTAVVITEVIPGEGGDADHEHDRPQLSPVNYWLLGVGGALALGAIGTGIWWRKRVLERNRIKRELDWVAQRAPARGPVFALQASGDGFGLLLRGRL